MEKVNDINQVNIINVRVLHFRFDEKGELKRYSRKNHLQNNFKPQTKGGMSVVSVTFEYNSIFESDDLYVTKVVETVMGSSQCSVLDNFSYRTGRILALHNALKKIGNYSFEDASEINWKLFG